MADDVPNEPEDARNTVISVQERVGILESALNSYQASIGSLESKNEHLSNKLESAKKEIDALQIAFDSKAKPWYKDVAAIVAAIALLFSFGTTYVSYRSALRQELITLLERLDALPKENLEFMVKYTGDNRRQASSLITQEGSMLVREAADTATRLPRGSVSASEYLSIAAAFQGTSNFDQAREFVNKALSNDPSFADRIAGFRALAGLLFLEGRAADGRLAYQQAVDIFSTYPEYKSYDDMTRAITQAVTEISWADSEAISGDHSPELALKHLDAAESTIKRVPFSPFTMDAYCGIWGRRKSLGATPPQEYQMCQGTPAPPGVQ